MWSTLTLSLKFNTDRPLLNTISLPEKVMCLLGMGVESGDPEGKRHWKQALESPLTPCTKWYFLN